MEQKNNVTNADYFNNFTNNEKNVYDGQIFNKSCIKKYHSKNNILIPKKNELNTMTINNESKKKQKQIKQCFYDLIKTKEQKEKNIRKDCVAITNAEENHRKPITITSNINKTELKYNKIDSKIKNIKVNKIKIEKINKENDIKINSNTNRNFYQKSSKDFNLFPEEQRNSNNYLSDFRSNENNEKNEKNLRRTNMISVKSFNKSAKDSALLNAPLQNSEFINYMNPIYNKDNNDFSLSNKNNKYNMSTNTYSHTTDGRSKLSNSSKIIISFKNIKTIYAHFEIFLSLYLKRIFKFFIEKLNTYEKPKNMGKNIQIQPNVYSEGNNYRPILNVNNVHCSLYSSININQDKLFSTIYDSQYLNSSLSPLVKTNEFIKGDEIINKRNRLLFVEPDYNMNLSTNKRSEKANNKSVYIPKKKISKSKTDLFNGLNQKKSTINIKHTNNFNHKLKSSPIKEMNINLRQINMSKINNLNPNAYKDNNGNFGLLEISPIIKINNNINITNHSKYNSNNIYTINPSSNNLSKEKNKLKKFQSAKNGVYIKPKEKNKKSKIKEIKINKKLSPIRKDIENHRRYNNLITDNISTVDSSIFKNRYLKDVNKTKDININMYTINHNNEQNTIKKIYINRNSKNKTSNNFNLKEKILNSYQKQFYSNYLEYKSEHKKNNNNINNEILITNFVSPDKRIFINEKYMIINSNYIKRNKNLCRTLNLDIDNQFSISIVSNIINESKEINNILLNKLNNSKINVLDIYSFDDNKKEKTPEVIKTKNIFFFFKDHTITKEESIIDKTVNEDLCNFINILKKTIVKNIKKFIYIIIKRKIILIKLIKKKNNKIINYYFSKLKCNNKSNNVQFISDKNSYGIYHKINYNDDYNLNKRLKTPKNFKKNINANPHCKTKPYNLNCHNGINQHNSKKKLDRKRSNERIASNSNYKSINKYINKEMNICVHNNTNINNNNKSKIDEIKKLKNKLFSFRIKLIISAIKKAKNAL